MMELSTEMIMEIALNSAGYLAAGLLSVVIFSMFRRKTAVVAERAGKTGEEPSTMASDTLAQPINNTKTVFVPLNESNIAAPNTSHARRNRGEVIRLARQMLNSGTSGEQVRQLLPITKGELSILITDN